MRVPSRLRRTSARPSPLSAMILAEQPVTLRLPERLSTSQAEAPQLGIPHRLRRKVTEDLSRNRGHQTPVTSVRCGNPRPRSSLFETN